jgi:hypothetical protein
MKKHKYKIGDIVKHYNKQWGAPEYIYWFKITNCSYDRYTYTLIETTNESHKSRIFESETADIYLFDNNTELDIDFKLDRLIKYL